MKRTTRLLAGVFATLALTVGLTATTVGTAAASGTDAGPRDYPAYNAGRTAFPGMFIDFTGDMSRKSDGTLKYRGEYCTLGVVGTDAAGRKVGITAGHCNAPQTQSTLHLTVDGDPCTANAAGCIEYPDNPKHVGAVPGVPVTDNSHPVYDLVAVKWAQSKNLPLVDPIGWIRWVDPKGDVEDLTGTTDYMVIEFAPEVQLSSQVKDKAGNAARHGNGSLFKVNSIYSDASGAPVTPPLSNLFPWGSSTWIENFGARSDRTPNIYSVGVNVGAVTFVNSNGLIHSLAAMQAGDSGGPVVMNGTGKWVGISSADLGLSNYVTTSAKNILNDLNPRGIVGSGFTITNN